MSSSAGRGTHEQGMRGSSRLVGPALVSRLASSLHLHTCLAFQRRFVPLLSGKRRPEIWRLQAEERCGERRCPFGLVSISVELGKRRAHPHRSRSSLLHPLRKVGLHRACRLLRVSLAVVLVVDPGHTETSSESLLPCLLSSNCQRSDLPKREVADKRRTLEVVGQGPHQVGANISWKKQDEIRQF